MIISKFQHKGVNNDGTVEGGGAVHTKGGVTIINGGCSFPQCHCSDGFFLVVTLPLKDRKVDGIKVHFKSKDEMIATLVGQTQLYE